MIATVHLGFEVGAGAPVEIPIAHMVVCGQTQLSGKTTTLDSLAAATGARTLAFVTKRGEGSFTAAHRIPPYFRPRTDWQFVEAILESTMRQRMKFERAWIVKAARGAKTLADVRENVRKLQAASKRSMDADIFMLLGEYLDQVLPVLSRLPPANGVELAPGVNVVDLSPYPVEVAGLVISSMLGWVHEQEEGVIVVVPESWKFIPQGRNSPVRMAAVSLAREGAGLRNFLWLDSQDLAGVEKEIVRACSVYLLGVQREANEIKRTLDHVPAGTKKPQAKDIATLARGQFFACWGTRAVKTYVQPIWLNAETARVHAMGMTKFEDLDPRPLLAMARAVKMPADWPKPKEDEMNPEQEKKLDRLIDAVTGLSEKMTAPISITARMPDLDPDRTARALHKIAVEKGSKGIDPARPGSEGNAVFAGDEEALYRRFVDRIKSEAPALLRVLADVPELEVEVTRYTIQVDGKTLRGKIAQLIAGGYFDAAKRNGDLKTELDRVGFNSAPANNLRELKTLAEMGFFTLEGDRFKAVPGMKVRIVEK